jgi:signal transduction histidine kinase
VVRKVVNGRRRQFIRQELFPHLSVEAADCTVLSDAKWLAFAVDQVVGNALKYGAQAGQEGQSLTIRLRSGERCLELNIADTGPGIPPQDLPRVFEPFFTGENGRKYAGATGVGLYLVRRVMDELGHDVSIQSTPGEGTTVTFRFVTEV